MDANTESKAKKVILYASILSYIISILSSSVNKNEIYISIRNLNNMLRGVISEKTVTRYLEDFPINEFIRKKKNGFFMKSINSSESPCFEATENLYNFLDKIDDSNEILIFDYDNISKKSKIVWNNGFYNSAKEAADYFFKDRKKTLSEYQEKIRCIQENSKTIDIVNSSIINRQKSHFVNKLFDDIRHDIIFSHYAKLDVDYIEKKLKTNIPFDVAMLYEYLKHFSDDDGNIKINYYRSEHGRLFASTNMLQFFPATERRKILSEYAEIDISSAIFTILYEYSKQLDIDVSEFKELKKLVENPDYYKENLFSYLLPCDTELSKDYLKTILNSLVYGSNFSEKSVLTEISRGLKKSVLLYTKGFSDLSVPLTIAGNEHIQKLRNDVKEMGKKLLECHKYDNYIINKQNQKMELIKGMRYGKKIAHIYQGIESYVLMKLTEFPIDNKKLIEYKNSIGLLLHDGIYIKKTFLDFDIISEKKLSEFIKNETGLNLKFKIKG